MLRPADQQTKQAISSNFHSSHLYLSFPTKLSLVSGLFGMAGCSHVEETAITPLTTRQMTTFVFHKAGGRRDVNDLRYQTAGLTHHLRQGRRKTGISCLIFQSSIPLGDRGMPLKGRVQIDTFLPFVISNSCLMSISVGARASGVSRGRRGLVISLR